MGESIWENEVIEQSRVGLDGCPLVRPNGQQRWRITILAQMVFREPDIVEAMLLSPDNLLKNLAVNVGIGSVPGRWVAKIVKQTKPQRGLSVRVHYFFFLIALLSVSAKCYFPNST